ncbi:transposase [Paenibacillus apiarius]|uniref:transposase n=1 Tax=Paenibacillus apiarius TaxID=46240 RepID=UPI003B3B21BF
MVRRNYEPEYKMKIVLMIEEQGEPMTQVAQKLGIPKNTLYSWISKYKQDGP